MALNRKTPSPSVWPCTGGNRLRKAVGQSMLEWVRREKAKLVIEKEKAAADEGRQENRVVFGHFMQSARWALE